MANLGHLKPYAHPTKHPRAVVDGRVVSVRLMPMYLGKLGADDDALAALAELAHVDFTRTRCDASAAEDAMWRKLRLPRARVLDGVHAWCFAAHATGSWLERITQLRNFSFKSSDASEIATMLDAIRRKLPALETIDCVGIGALEAEMLDKAFAGSQTRVACELAGFVKIERPLEHVRTRPMGPLDTTWLDEVLSAP